MHSSRNAFARLSLGQQVAQCLTRVGLAPLLVASMLACTERPTGIAPSDGVRRSAVVAQPEVPPAHWRDASDDYVWRTIISTDTSVYIGLKSPGSARGVVRGKAQLSTAEWRGGIEAISHQPGVRVISVDSAMLPMLVVVPSDLATLRRLRHLPFVDFLEPRIQRTIYAQSAGCNYSSLGVSGESSGGDVAYGGTLLQIPWQAGYDVVSAVYGSPGMNVPNAWLMTAGDNVKIGITDTGLDIDYPSEFSNEYFTSGLSTDRGLVPWQNVAPSCSHGTRIAGLAAAPRNLRSIVGVAYQADVVTVYQADGEWPNQMDAANAINQAGQWFPKVIVMAWANETGSSAIDYMIEHYYYQQDVMFVGAAGTCPFGDSCPRMDSAMYPSSKEEVLAVTGANHDGTKPSGMYNYGAKSGVLAYTNLATTGMRTQTVVKLGGSSGATGFVGGVAALVRARNPQLTARQAMDRIIYTSGSTCGAPYAWRQSMINVSAAVGGPCVYFLLGPASYYIHDNYAPDGHEENAWVLVSRTFTSGFQPGGSGSYHATWEYGPGIQANAATTEDNITDANGNTYWRSLRRVKFLHAYDSGPYLATITVRVADDVLGTVDVRKLDVTVCESPTQCSTPYRLFPGSIAPLSMGTISGPQYINRGQSGQYFATAQNGAPPYTYEWHSRDGKNWTFGNWQPWYSTGSQNYTFASVNGCNINMKQLEARGTDASGNTGITVTYTIFVNNPC